jgi:pyruvate/2-oxoglutarate dehydrogenase complex dihydrolipoamide dehydrogenase (E3) component
MANKVVNDLDEIGIEMKEHTVIKSVVKRGERDFEVELETKKGSKAPVIDKVHVNTILMAIGRDGNPESFGATKAGIKLLSNKIMAADSFEVERTSVENIYGVGDIVHGVPELMPVA